MLPKNSGWMLSQEPEEEGCSVLCQGEWLVSCSQEAILNILKKGNVTDRFAVSEEWVRDMTEERGKHAAKISSQGDWLEALMKRV